MASVSDDHFDMSFDHDETLEMDVSLLDGDPLMELLEEYSQPEEAVTGASCSPPVGSTDAVGGMQDAIHPHDEYCEDCGLDDMLSDLCCHGCSGSISPMSPGLVEEDRLDWKEMAAAASLPGGNMGEWYVDDFMHGCGMCFAHGDLHGCSSLCMHMDNSVCEVYSSPWE